MTRLPIVLLAAALSVTPASSVAQTAEPAVRAGDSAMTCEMIIDEINTSAAAQAEAARRAESGARARRGLMSFARGALSVAAPMLAQGGLGGDMGSTVAQLAMQQAQSGVQQQAMSAAMGALSSQAAPQGAEASAAQSPRQAHLTAMFGQRGC